MFSRSTSRFGAPLRRLLITGLLLLSSAAVTFSAQAQQWAWAAQSDPAADGSTLATVADARGNVYVAGYLNGPTTFGATTLPCEGSTDIFIAKLDSTGQWAWAQRAGSDAGVPGSGDFRETAMCLSLDSAGNLYVGGHFADTARFGSFQLVADPAVFYEAFVASLTPAGQWRWAKSITNTNPVQGQGGIRQIAVDPTSGAVYVAGFLSGTAVLGTTTISAPSSHFTAFLAKLDPGSQQWEWGAAVGVPAPDLPTIMGAGVALDAAGRPYLFGSFHGRATFGAVTLQVTSSSADGFVAALTPTGQWRWVRQIEALGLYHVRPFALAINRQGTIYSLFSSASLSVRSGPLLVAGRGGYDAYLTTLDTAGTWQSILQVGGLGDDEAQGLALDAAGDAYVGGMFTGTAQAGSTSFTSAGGKDIFVAKASGSQWAWAMPAGGSGDDVARSVAVRPDGAMVYAAGHFSSASLPFGASALSSSGTSTASAYNGTLFTAAWQPSTTTGRVEAAAATLALFPNPATTTARLTLPEAPTVARLVHIFDALGRTVRQTWVPAGQVETPLDLRSLPAGLYVVRAGAASRRMVVE